MAVDRRQQVASWPGHRWRRLAASVTVDASQRAAWAGAWQALWASRLLVWVAGLYAMLAVGFRPGVVEGHVTAPFGPLGNLLVSPAARWDAGWYLSIASHPYQSAPQSAFFPLYPLAMRELGLVLGSALVAGIVIALAAFAAALYLLARLVAVELGPEYARPAVLALAFFPTAVFFSAVYSESLLLALTIGAVYCARTGRWAWAGILAGLASATRNTGVLIALTLVMMYLYGPRGDRADTATTRWWRPRYPPRADVLWLALAPAGLGAFLLYMGLAHGDALLPLHVNETYWHRHFALLSAIPLGARTLWDSLQQIGSATPGVLQPATNLGVRTAASNVVDAAFLVFGVLATVGVVRRLPLAYGVYCIASLVFMVSAPKAIEPLASVPRYLAVLFPLHMWLALWAGRGARLAVWLGASGVALGVITMQFATWRWAA